MKVRTGEKEYESRAAAVVERWTEKERTRRKSEVGGGESNCLALIMPE